MKKSKKYEVDERTDEELEKITSIYKGLNTTNRYLVVSATGLLLASQEAKSENKKVGCEGQKAI